ncbi:uncharacterized protein LOC142236393 [Haematobia irritans]|uniref:uncharacterized protein LOC142220933 n=1 Tax=Haematobia irritans TaxID=7368 RepID=UPI003F50BCD7
MDTQPPPRNVRVDIHNLEREIQRYKREPLDQAAYQAGLNRIHEDTVAEAVRSYKVNPVLGVRPPPIAPEERDLPRQTRVVLAQLRSGKCSRLNSYLSVIDSSVADVCPVCNQGPHDTRHLFSCPAKPTRLTTRSLWTHHTLVAEFLDLPTS